MIPLQFEMDKQIWSYQVKQLEFDLKLFRRQLTVLNQFMPFVSSIDSFQKSAFQADIYVFYSQKRQRWEIIYLSSNDVYYL